MVNSPISIKLKFNTLSCVENTPHPPPPPTHTLSIKYYILISQYHVEVRWQLLTDKMSDDVFLCETVELMSKSTLKFFTIFASTCFSPTRRGDKERKTHPGNEPFSRIRGRSMSWYPSHSSHTWSHHWSTHNYVPYLQHVQDKNYCVTYEAYDNDDDVIMVFLPFHLWIILCIQESLLNKSQGY